jgi:RNA polymerase sigma-70 factor (ECF subfamily)
MSSSDQEQKPQPAQWFATTHWSVVLAAGHDSSPGAQEALEKLCSAYWYPLYAYVRRKGHSQHDAEDLTQSFFAQLLERHSLRQVRGEGKFRSFLLAALEHFLANEWKRARRQKRGGQCDFISLDGAAPEVRYQLEPVEGMSAEKIYDRRWALTVLEQALEELRRESATAGKEQLFDALKSVLAGDKPDAPYAQISEQLNMSEGAIKIAAHRLRKRYAELVREEIAQTVADPTDLEQELSNLLAALRG